MNALGSWHSRSMRVLSPRIEPPEIELEGSTASTATRWPWPIRCRPRASMNVDFPDPGEPLIPTRIDRPVAGKSASSTASARAWWSRRVDSTSVIALASARAAREHAIDELLVGGFQQDLAGHVVFHRSE